MLKGKEVLKMKQLYLMRVVVSTPYEHGGQYAMEMTATQDAFEEFKRDCMESIRDGESVISITCLPIVCRDSFGNWCYAHA